MREATFYFSDVHLGASKDNLELVKSAFDVLTSFLRDHHLKVLRAIDVGDHVETWLPGFGFEKRYEDSQIIGMTRHMYKRIFPIRDRKVAVLASAGNHQTDILDSGCSDKEAMASSVRATKELSSFLDRVFDGCSCVDHSVFRGIKQTEDHVFAHHGDFLDTKGRFRSVLSRLDDDMTIEDKINYINSRSELYGVMQERWRWFKKNLWPRLKWFPPGRFADITFPFYVRAFKELALRREKQEGQSTRNLAERQKNPIYDSVQLQLELLRELAERPENSAVISGHTHVPGMVSGVNGQPGTVVTLGAWHDTHLKPAVAISTELDDRKQLLLVEYDDTARKWNIRDEKQF